jgi:hypothetical protein
MFVICLPKTFKIGDTAEVRINLEPARVTYRDKDTLVIEPEDARAILMVSTNPGADLVNFACADPGKSAEDYALDPRGVLYEK